MQAYLLEILFPTGWRRAGEVHWRFADAERASKLALHEDYVRGIRILAARVHPDAIAEYLPEFTGGGSDE